MRYLLAGLIIFISQVPVCALGDDNAASSQEEKEAKYSIDAMTQEEYLKSKGINVNSGKDNGDYKCYKGVAVYDSDGDSQERYYCIEKTKNGEYNAEELLSSTDDEGAGCPIVSVSWYYNRDCKFCKFLKTAYIAADHITHTAFDKFAKSFANLIVIVFVIWLAIRTLNHAAFLTPQDAAKYITDILIQAFKFLLAYFALKYYKEVYDLLLEPIFKSGLDFADKFVDVGITRSEPTKDLKLELYSAELYDYMEKFSYDVNYQFSLLSTVGSSLNCLGAKFLHLKYILDGDVGLGMGINCKIYGIFFSLIGWLLALSFIFYLFDAVVEYGIFGAICPFALACWPFKMFTSSANNALKMFMNSVFTFMMAGVAVKVSVTLIANAIAASAGGGIAELVQAMDTIDTVKLKPLIAVISIDFLVFAFASLSGFLLVGKIKSLTDTFAGGGMSSIAPSIGTMAASATKGSLMKVAQPTLKALDNKATAAVVATTSAIVHNNPVAKVIGKLKANIKEEKQGNPNAQAVNVDGGKADGAKPDSGTSSAGGAQQPSSGGAPAPSGGNSSPESGQ